MPSRRQLLVYLVSLSLAPWRALGTVERAPVRIGITPVFQTERTSTIRAWRDYLERRLERPVSFEQSNTYRDIINNLLARRLDFAWICGLPYVSNRSRLALTAAPLYQGAPLYRSYLIVPARDTTTERLADLRDKVFAYADPDSNSGFLVPHFQLIQQGLDPDTFFRKTFFTSGHSNAIKAVGVGLADGAHVDGYIWETMQRFNPEITDLTRVVTQSKPFAFPPIVAGPKASPELNTRMRDVLLAMGSDPDAVQLLDHLNLDGFTRITPAAYKDIAEMAQLIEERQHVQ
ncbi:phosphate/phosphite/phosphonate ABC transporter substrate-binding protein [Marinobacter sp. Arc7-DN-1]|uniref:substrate-binding domain-containing protein n=1 Tax=Marinobacter sp. Arc7-DN-1 TaxID=2304594 RepID=UPI0013C2BF97|nr:phosphate/phosphite/phosphonate ABC transporter substrate-binding protein [Marinobacter sp. Arc7-DN-1]